MICSPGKGAVFFEGYFFVQLSFMLVIYGVSASKSPSSCWCGYE